MSAAQAAGTRFALCESFVGTTTRRGSCGLGMRSGNAALSCLARIPQKMLGAAEIQDSDELESTNATYRSLGK
jgi:hypothetical protein